ncbi:MAG TPA: hypothetical protein VIG99_18825 [Myxococcaceae bacterium]|jgi:hypothetical protein
MKVILLPLALLLLYSTAPQCEVRGPQDAGADSGRRDSGTGDGGRDSGTDPPPPDGGFPGSGREGDPGTDVLFLVRMDRGLANDANLYERLVEQVRGALKSSGLTVLQTAVASLQDGQLLWGRFAEIEPPVSLARVLAYYAQQMPDQSAPCSTTGLAQLGSTIPYNWLTYPPELTDIVWYEQPLTIRPGALLVVVIDHDVRPQPPSSFNCLAGGMSPADWFGGGNYPLWQSGWSLHRPRTRFWTIFTPEGSSNSDPMRQSCLASGFPAWALDTISVSPVSFYGSWAIDMNARYPGLVSSADFCSSMLGNLPAKAWANDWVQVLLADMP